MVELSIGELAARGGLSPQTIRYYERVGLIPSPQRSGSGYRVYLISSVERLKFIRKAQALGLSLSEIKGILSMADRGRCPCRLAKKRLRGRFSRIIKEMSYLREAKVFLEAVLRDACFPQCKGRKKDSICPIIDRLPLNKIKVVHDRRIAAPKHRLIFPIQKANGSN